LKRIDIPEMIREMIVVIEDVTEKIAEEIVVVLMTEIVIEILIDLDHRDATDHVSETGGGVDHAVAIVVTVVAIVETEAAIVVAIVVIAVATGDEDKFKLPILRNDCIFIRLPDKCTLRPKNYPLMKKIYFFYFQGLDRWQRNREI